MRASNILVVDLSPYRLVVAVSVGLHAIHGRVVLLCRVESVLVVLVVLMVLIVLVALMVLMVLMVLVVLVFLVALVVLMGVRLGRDRTNLLFQGVDLAAVNLPAVMFAAHEERNRYVFTLSDRSFGTVRSARDIQSGEPFRA